MRILPSTFTTVVLVAVFVVVSSFPEATFAWLPTQDGLDSPDISEPECSFYLDQNGDGEGEERFDAVPEAFVPQETPVVGGCTFRLETPAEATAIVESELRDWYGDIELKVEPAQSTEYKLYPGDNEIPGIQGSMVVTANIRGTTPRSVKSRSLPGDYTQEVQIPEEIRLFEVTVVTADGRRDRLERDVQTASKAYIQVDRQLRDKSDDMPEWAAELAQEFLDSGYPQLSDNLIIGATSVTSGGEGRNVWMWVAIITWILMALVAVVVSVLVIRNR